MINFQPKILFVLFCLCQSSLAQEFSNFNLAFRGGKVTIPENAIVEGSLGSGGMQPNYVFDVESDLFNDLKREVDDIKKRIPRQWDVIKAIVQLVQHKVFKYYDYNDPVYLEAMRNSRNDDNTINLSEYIKINAGTCREHALLTHFLLNYAGVPNKYVYGRVQHGEDIIRVEDHAFNVIVVDGQEWIVDSFSNSFNGFLLNDLMREDDSKGNFSKSPLTAYSSTRAKILLIHDFPKVFFPKNCVNELVPRKKKKVN